MTSATLSFGMLLTVLDPLDSLLLDQIRVIVLATATDVITSNGYLSVDLWTYGILWHDWSELDQMAERIVINPHL